MEHFDPPDRATPPRALVWLRDDLRLDDNPALAAAAASGTISVLYILEEDIDGMRPLGGAAKWWLHKSLVALGQDLAVRGVPLILRRGNPATILPTLARELHVHSVHWNRRYWAWSIPVDSAIKSALIAQKIDVQTHKANVMSEPWEIKNGSGDAFKVFTPFFKAAQGTCDAFAAFALDAPVLVPNVADHVQTDHLADWQLLPKTPDWASGLDSEWTPGESGAATRLNSFIAAGLTDYKENRNLPSVLGTSKLSPHLKFGEISIRRVWAAARAKMAADASCQTGGQTFLSELGWREFSYQLIFQDKNFTTQSWKPAFRDFPWRDDPLALRAWQKGKTGYPIVDAGLRELWATGWMHNRVRMIVASFLIKHLLIDWRSGEAWFWDTLVDADIANNAAGWQWVAGSGADASPFFRIFNPMTQGEKFDPKGTYVRKWVPELARLPDAFIHQPFEAPYEILAAAGVRLGQNYPRPIVDHKFGRDRALGALAMTKQAT